MHRAPSTEPRGPWGAASGETYLNKCINRPLGEPDPAEVDWVGVTFPRGLAMRMGRQGAA